MAKGQLKGLRPQDWQRLRDSFSSERSYKKRRIGIAIIDFENWLIDEKGADIHTQLLVNEVLRFQIGDEFGVVYSSGAGSLLSHKLAKEYIGASHDCCN